MVENVAFRVAIVGGDDLALGYARNEGEPSFRTSAKFAVNVEVEKPLIGLFTFHSRTHTPFGSLPHVIKLAGKALDKRYPPQEKQRKLALTEYQQSIRDQLNEIGPTGLTRATGFTADQGDPASG